MHHPIRSRSEIYLFALGAIMLPAVAGCSERSAGAREVDASAVPEFQQVVDTMPRDSVADLPRATVEPKYVAPTGRTLRVDAGGNLQRALDQAQPGDVVLLAPGATYRGKFVLPRKPCVPNAWITVRTDLPDSSLPPAGRRITPAYAPRLAKLVTENSGAALKTANPTCGWWLTAFEVTASPKLDRNTVNYGIMLMGDGGWREGGDDQTSLAKVPSRIVIDRMYIHGLPGTNTTRCLALNSAHSAVINSWLSDCHAKGFDSQAVEGWNGPGPFLIENNHLAGAGENLMFGGADPGIHGLVPSDITIRRNHFYKDPAWKGVWTVKNLFELKNAGRVLIEGNVFENNWSDAQSGMAIVIKSSHDSCGTCTWQGTRDVTFRYNIVKNSPRGFNLQAVDGESDRHVGRVRVEDNLFQNIGRFNDTGEDGWLLLLTHDLKDVTIAHNTFVHNVTTFGVAVMMDGYGQAKNLRINDNVFTSPAGYALFHSGVRVGVESIKAMAGTSWTFERNVVAGTNPEFAPWHPQQSWYPPKLDGMGFLDPAGGDYRLAPRSPYKGRGKGGKDPGADFAKIRAATEGVVVR